MSKSEKNQGNTNTLTGGLALNDHNGWSSLHNPVLRQMAALAPQLDAEELSIIELPCPSLLSIELVYRGQPLQACVETGQCVARGEPLTYRLPRNYGSGFFPSIPSPVDAVVESINASGTGNWPKATLRTVNATPTDEPHRFRSDWLSLNRQQRWQSLRHSAIAGHGGGGFLLADKADLNRQANSGNNQKPVSTLIVNAVECEPLISCDAALIKQHGIDALHGVLTLVELTECETCVIAIEQGREWQQMKLQQCLDEIRKQRQMDTTSSELPSVLDRIEFLVVPAIYPQGAERVLFKTATGRQLLADEFPGDYGVCCTNIATCHAVYKLTATGYTPNQRIVTLTGDAVYHSGHKTGVNILAHYGTPISDLLNAVGINQRVNPAPIRLQLGGPVCGTALNLSDSSVDAATNCIVASHTSPIVQSDNCIRCGNCVEVCPESLLPQQLHQAVTGNSPDRAQKLGLERCLECGCCDLVCPSEIPLTQQFRQARRASAADRTRKINAEIALTRFASRELRMQQREAQRLALREKRKRESNDKNQKKKAIADALARAKNRKK